VERLCHELGLESSVRVGDPIDGQQKWRLIEQAVGLLHTSRWEGTSIAAAEAISIGVPTLVTHFPMGRFLASQGSVISGRAHAAGLGDDMARLLSDEAKATSESGLEFARAQLTGKRWPGRGWIRPPRTTNAEL
jgi:Glycosyl transferases group 1